MLRRAASAAAAALLRTGAEPLPLAAAAAPCVVQGGAPRWLHACGASQAVHHGRGRPPPGSEKPPELPGRVVNGDITARSVRVVFEDGRHEVLRRSEALALAKAEKLDLVQVDGTASPPVCRLLDYERLRSGERIKEKAARRKAVERRHADVTKELRLSLRTQPHDLHTKAAAAARALEAGHKAKISVLFKNAREAADPSSRTTALQIFADMRAAIQEEAGGASAPPIAKEDAPPKIEGSTLMWTRLAPAQLQHAVKAAKPKAERPKPAAEPGVEATVVVLTGTAATLVSIRQPVHVVEVPIETH